jgi:hypothetical protein
VVPHRLRGRRTITWLDSLAADDDWFCADEREPVLDRKPRHWRAWYDGRLVSNHER